MVVLRQTDVGEADRIASVLTAERGRIEVRIPQARRSRKRFGGLDLFVLATVSFVPGRRVPKLAGAVIERSFEGIRSDIERLALAGYAAELLRRAAPEEQAAPELMRLAEAALASLDVEAGSGVGGQGWARAFELKLLHCLGVRPSLRRDAASGESLGAGPLRWSVRLGGVLSEESFDEDPMAQRIDRTTVARLDEALHRPLSEQGDVAWGGSAGEASVALERYVGEHVGVVVKARRFLEQIVPLLLLLALTGCAGAGPGPVRLQGFLFDSTAPPDDDRGVVGADGAVFDSDGVELAEASAPFADFPEFYRFDGLPEEALVHARFDADGHRSTWISGTTAPEDLFVDRGVFHLWTDEAWAFEQQNWAAGLPPGFAPPLLRDDVPGEGGVILGSMADPVAAEGARLFVEDAEGFAWPVQYRDGLGRPGAEAITQDGRFGVFGVPPGTLSIHVERSDGTRSALAFDVPVSEDAITSLPGYSLP